MKYIKTHSCVNRLSSNIKLIKRISQMNNGDFCPKTVKTIKDNVRMLLETAKETSEGLKGIRSLPKNENSSGPLILYLAENIISDFEYKIDEKNLAEYLNVFQNEERFLTINELFFLKLALSYICLERLCEILKSKKDTDTAEKIIDCLYSLKDIDFENVYTSVSYTESILLKDPLGVYVLCDNATKSMYRRKISETAQKKNVTEFELIDEYFENAIKETGKKRHIGYYILKDRELKAGNIYYFALTMLPIMFSIPFLLISFCYKSYLGVISSILLPLILRKYLKTFIEMLIRRNTATDILPRYEIFGREIPSDAKTMVIYTVVLTNEEKDKELFCKLSNYAHAYDDKNLTFAILFDLPDSSTQTNETDDRIIDFAKTEIDKINREKDVVVMFYRRRVYSKSEGKYIGSERKRGAQEELIKLLKGERSSLISYGANYAQDYKYLITLDYDTEILYSDIKKLIATAEHPLNKPDIGYVNATPKVVEGYGVIQPKIEISLLNANDFSKYTVYKNAFEGKNEYETAEFSAESKISGVGSFCGKGLINIDAYYEVLKDRFPSEKILSHDIAEGLFLRAGFASDIKMFDSPVCSYESEKKRRHRWMRGDVQALVLATKQITDKHGKKIVSPLNYNQKERLYDNVYDIIFDIARPLLLFLSLFSSGVLGIFLFLLSIADYLLSLGKMLVSSFNIPCRRYLSGAPNYYKAFFVSLFLDFGSIPDRFCSSADALIRSLWRLNISKRKLLEWSVSNCCEAKVKSSIAARYLSFKSNVILGAMSIIFSVTSIDRFSSIVLLLSGAIWLIHPYCVSRLDEAKRKKLKTVTKDDIEDLREHARVMWNYFTCNVTDETNHLPPDNVTIIPYRKIAERTSPTNIGMYLLSLVNAFDFGFIGSEELYHRLSETLKTIKQLEKWNGHLFNWYSTRTCTPLSPKYVSTVDSGNLIVSLETVKSAIDRFGKPFDTILDDLKALINDADFIHLYNKKRDLFYIGYNESAGKYDNNVYDLYMSEMLSTSFYSVAKGFVPSNHLSKLRKPLNEKLKTSPMLSWSGTAFEYFMPSIFLPRCDRTERGEALLAAYNCQKYNRLKYNNVTVFGKSESGYYDFDDSMNYRYKAHGTKDISISNDSYADNVFAPYSLYLMLGYGEDVFNTLRSLYNTDLCGTYGLYEAIDFSEKRVGKGYGIVSQYMSHHIGMSITSIANYCLDGINIKRFLSDAKIASALPYLYNKIEICRPKDEIAVCRAAETEKPEISEVIKYSNNDTALISNSITKVIADKNGNFQIYNGKNAVIKFENGSVSTFLVFLKTDEIKYNCVAGSGKRSFVFDGYTAKYINEYNVNGNDIKTELSITVDPENTVVYLGIKTSGYIKNGELLVFFIPLLNDLKAYESSPSYSDIFLTSEFEEDGSVTFTRGKGEKSLNVSVSSEIKNWFTKAHEVLPFLYTEEDIKNLFEYKIRAKQNGAVVFPLCAFLTETENNKETEIRLRIGPADHTNNSCEEVKQKAKKHFMLMSSLASADQMTMDLSLLLIQKITFEKSMITKIDNDAIITYNRDIFWRHGISGDLPIVLFVFGDKSQKNLNNEINTLLKAKRFLFLNGIRFDLIFITENEGYNNDNIKILHAEIQRCGCEMLLNKDNGIYIIKNSALTENDKAVLTAGADHIIDYSDEILPKHEKSQKNVNSSIVKSTTAEKPFCEIYGSQTTIKNGRSPSPWCMIYANHIFGTLLTNKSAGFTWYQNSALGNVTKRHLDPTKAVPGETLILHYKSSDYDILSFAESVEYLHGCAVYKCRINNVFCTVSIGIDAKLPFKLYHLTFENIDGEKYSVSLNVTPAVKCILCDDEFSLLNEHGIRMKLLSVGDHKKESLTIFRDSISINADISNDKCAFILAANKIARNEKLFRYVKNKYRSESDVIYAFNEYEEQKLKTLSDHVYRGSISFIEKQLAFSAYQALYFRMLARCGYSQSGGAYGFRDQLQDSLSALYFDPEITKLQILRSCQRQYEDGRCQHWWHPYVGGLRSRCSDDYMWLLYVTSEYILATLDKSILDYKISFLSSPELSEDEEDRYENPGATTEKYTVKEHLLRAYEASKERGEHGLPLMLSGDWNDGMNEVGNKGRGESVWLAFFFVVTYRKTAEALLLADRGNSPIAEEMLLLADKVLKAAEGAWDGGWYLRAYDDDGKVLGSKNSPECRIDIIPQAFSVFAKADPKRSRIAMKNAEVLLYNKKHGIFRLFAPSFDKLSDYGYICRYPAGIRENGGQYTHAAIFAAMAYFEIGEEYTGLEILRSLSPNDIYESGRCKRFSSEPYLLAADIYYGDGITGKSGWSGYTGSAAWYYRVTMKYVLGIEPEFGKFKITPKRLNSENYTVNLTFNGKKISFDFVFEGSKADTEGYDLIFVTEYEKSVYVTPENKDLKILIKVSN